MRTLSTLAVLSILAGSLLGQASRDADDLRGVQLTIESSTLPETDRKEIARVFHNQTYDTVDELSERLRDALQVRGYFRASVGSPRVSFISERRGGKIADIHISVEEGSRYRLGEIRFKNGMLFSVEEMRRAIPIQAGELFNVEKMREGIQNLRNLYEAKGYVNFTPVPDTAMDDTHHTVDLTFDFDEGERFYFGPLVLYGPEPHIGARAALLESWKSLEGQPYNPEAVRRWFVANLSNLAGDAHSQAYVWKSLETSIDRSTHLVTPRFWLP